MRKDTVFPSLLKEVTAFGVRRNQPDFNKFFTLLYNLASQSRTPRISSHNQVWNDLLTLTQVFTKYSGIKRQTLGLRDEKREREKSIRGTVGFQLQKAKSRAGDQRYCLNTSGFQLQMSFGRAGQERKDFLISLHIPYSCITKHSKFLAIGSKIGKLKETIPRNSKD